MMSWWRKYLHRVHAQQCRCAGSAQALHAAQEAAATAQHILVEWDARLTPWRTSPDVPPQCAAACERPTLITGTLPDWLHRLHAYRYVRTRLELAHELLQQGSPPDVVDARLAEGLAHSPAELFDDAWWVRRR